MTSGAAPRDLREIWPDEFPAPFWPHASSAGTTPIVTVPDDWTVWAFSDPHAVLSGFSTALQEAGLVDEELAWAAPPATALVGCGDYIDRGRESRALVDLLRRLTAEAAAAGGGVWLTRGNHEHLLQHLHEGGYETFDHWLQYGGDAALDAYGCGPADLADPEATIRCLEAADAELFPWLAGLHHAVRWRDVLFVHGGPVPYAAPEDLGTTTDRHLWIRTAFFDTPWESGAFDAYRAAGIERVVYGHTAVPDGPRILQGGRSLNLDTNACVGPTMPAGAVAQMTLIELVGDVPFDEARYVGVPTHDAPDRVGGG
jgi:serine/threonine protein phosphatase 1